MRKVGFTLLELTVAAALLAAVTTASLQMLRALTDQQRMAERRAIAIQAVQVVSEQTSNLRWEELTQDRAATVTIPRQLESALPGAKLAIDVTELKEPVETKRIQVRLDWVRNNGQPGTPARLTTWVFPPELRRKQ